MNKKTLHLPLRVYTAFYAIIVVAGCILSVWGPEIVNQLNTMLTGVRWIDLSAPQKATLVTLLVFPPALLFTFFYIAIYFAMRFFKIGQPKPGSYFPGWFKAEYAAFLLIVIYLATKLATTGLIGLLPAWFSNYDQWIAARYAVFKHFSTVDFIVIYMFLPVTSILISIGFLKSNRKLAWVTAPIVLNILFMLFLFQKRPILIFLLMFGITLMFHYNEKIRFRYIFGTLLSLFILYTLMIVVPTLGIASTRIDSPIVRLETADVELGPADLPLDSLSPEKIKEAKKNKLIVKQLANSLNPNTITLLSTLNGIIFRVATPSIYYVKAYPDLLPFNGFDVPFDRVHPTDNTDVWKLMWPEITGGLVAVPAQFSMYSQVGTFNTLIVFSVLGFFLGLSWYIIVIFSQNDPGRIVQGMLVILFLIYLTMDSIYNSMIVSYGVLWGAALTEILILANYVIRKFRPVS